MAAMTRSQIDTFVSTNIANANLPESSISRSVKVISQGLVPFTYENLVALRDNSPHEAIRNAARDGFVKRFEKAGEVIDMCEKRGFTMEMFAKWLGVPSHSDAQTIIDRAVEYATLDVTMTLDPELVKLS